MLIQSDGIFCASCISAIRPIPSIRFGINKHLSLHVFSVSAYQNPVRTLITKKFSSDRRASRQLARLMLDFTPLRNKHYDYIVPVPLHWTRYAYRGFNQAQQIASVIGKDRAIPVISFVSRIKSTTYQSMLSKKDRQKNVQHVFDVHWWYKLQGADMMQDKHILIVDDLCTTGATLVQVAKVIAPFQPASLTAVVGGRAI